jgi:hypothetical protein
MRITSYLNRTSLPSCQAEQGGRAGTKKYLPPRHKDTKDFILLFFLSALVPLWRQKKVNAEFMS